MKRPDRELDPINTGPFDVKAMAQLAVLIRVWVSAKGKKKAKENPIKHRRVAGCGHRDLAARVLIQAAH